MWIHKKIVFEENQNFFKNYHFKFCVHLIFDRTKFFHEHLLNFIKIYKNSIEFYKISYNLEFYKNLQTFMMFFFLISSSKLNFKEFSKIF